MLLFIPHKRLSFRMQRKTDSLARATQFSLGMGFTIAEAANRKTLCVEVIGMAETVIVVYQILIESR